MARVIGFVDGFNLYHSINDQVNSKLDPRPHFVQYKWLDVKKVIQKFMPAEDTLSDVYFFSAISEANIESARRHKIYLQALQSTGAKEVLGKFKKKHKYCKNCKVTTSFPVEKKTDVNIAVRMLGAAFKDKYDKCFLVSGDTDLAPVLNEIKILFPHKSIFVISPMGRENGALRRIAHGHGTISEEILKDSMFTNPIVVPGKTEIHCPSEWVWPPPPPPTPQA